MKLVCMHCGYVIRHYPPFGDGAVVYGQCNICKRDKKKTNDEGRKTNDENLIRKPVEQEKNSTADSADKADKKYTIAELEKMTDTHDILPDGSVVRKT